MTKASKARRPSSRKGKSAEVAPMSSDEGEQARLAVNLPLELHRQLKMRAAEQGKSIRDYVLGLLEKEGINARRPR